jgi:SAM-dependent methyltransferase
MDEQGHAFEAVDAARDPAALIRSLDVLSREPFYRQYKRRLRELVAPRAGERFLELGAGTGDDARDWERASGARVLGLDRSRVMMREARRRGLACALVADAARLPCADQTFDGCWADRLFQHLADPQRVLAEMIRVTRPGGRLAVVDPDYGTQDFTLPDRRLAGRVLRFREERGLRQGRIAHRMAEHFAAASLVEIRAESMRLEVRDPEAVDGVMGLRGWAVFAEEAGYLSEEDVDRWQRLYDAEASRERFRYGVTFYLTLGRKP